MIKPTEIRQAYIDLYIQIRKYIWDIDGVTCLAELEVLAHTTFPDLDKLAKKLKTFKLHINDTMREDDDLKEAYEAFVDLVDSEDSVAMKLPTFRKVVPVNETN